MYYNSNQNSNEYYSSYKQELSAVESNRNKKNSMSLPQKAGLSILLLGLIGFGSPYLVNYFSEDNTTLHNQYNIDEMVAKKNISHESMLKKTEDTNDIPKIVISEDQLPKSIQIQNSESKIIANIKRNATDSLEDNFQFKDKEHNEIKRQVISLTETANMNSADIEKIVNIILAKKKEKSESSLEEQLLNAEIEESPTQTLKESNHYNKVVLSSKNENVNNKIINLNDNATVPNKKIHLSKYEKSLKPEIAIRSNEMRIIIVKKGDSLSKLALKAYGDKLAYDKIFKANPEIIKNPNEIFIGQKLRIPL